MLQAHDLAVEFDRTPLFADVRLGLARGDKVAFVGPNGAAEALESPQARTVLGALELRDDAAVRPIGTLSMGERTRVELTGLLLSGANVLLLDEPTNGLDLPSREALEAALREYAGAVVFTSHDPRFVEGFADRVVRL